MGIVIYSNDPEVVWNAFRFGNFALKAGDEVKVIEVYYKVVGILQKLIIIQVRTDKIDL